MSLLLSLQLAHLKPTPRVHYRPVLTNPIFLPSHLPKRSNITAYFRFQSTGATGRNYLFLTFFFMWDSHEKKHDTRGMAAIIETKSDTCGII